MVSDYRENGAIDFKRYNLKPLSNKAIEDLESLLGKDYSGYRHAINSNAIMHTEKRHGEHGEQDTSMSNPKDVARIQYVLDNYDSVELASEKEGEYSKEFRDKNDKPMRKIVYKKKSTGHIISLKRLAKMLIKNYG